MFLSSNFSSDYEYVPFTVFMISSGTSQSSVKKLIFTCYIKMLGQKIVLQFLCPSISRSFRTFQP